MMDRENANAKDQAEFASLRDQQRRESSNMAEDGMYKAVRDEARKNAETDMVVFLTKAVLFGLRVFLQDESRKFGRIEAKLSDDEAQRKERERFREVGDEIGAKVGGGEKEVESEFGALQVVSGRLGQRIHLVGVVRGLSSNSLSVFLLRF